MRTLQDLIESKDNIVDYFFNDTVSQFVRSRTDLFSRLNLIEREYTGWRDEQRAAHETCILANLSHHMPTLYVKGPDAQKLLQYLTPVNLSNIIPGKAKQYFAVSPRGYHIGDCILYYHGEEAGFELNSGMPVLNWVRYNGEVGDYDVEIVFEPTTPFNPTGKRKKFRFQIEGPTARNVLEDVFDGGWPDLKFFSTKKVSIGGIEVTVLGHSMSGDGGNTGAEISGDFEHLETIRSVLLEAGKRHGLRQGGTLFYFSHGMINGWIPYPLPAIYSGEDMQSYREWLPAEAWEANIQIGGSLYSENIEEYYWTPSALGYDRLVHFDHDFIGRRALEVGHAGPRQVKRMLVWHPDDVTEVMRSQFTNGPRYKSMELPIPIFGWPQSDVILSGDSAQIGKSLHVGYIDYGPDMLSLCCIDEAFAAPGTEVSVVWGEPNGGSRKLNVEPHEQIRIRAKVIEAPYTPDKGYR